MQAKENKYDKGREIRTEGASILASKSQRGSKARKHILKNNVSQNQLYGGKRNELKTAHQSDQMQLEIYNPTRDSKKNTR